MNQSIQNQRGKILIPIFVIGILVVIYIANCFSPLRLTHDTIRYLNIKEWIEAGKPADDPAGKDFLPYGYVWLLLLLAKLNLAKSVFISAIHLCYLLASLWFIRKIFGTTIRLWQLAAICLLNWAMLKFVITPLSEMQFLFFSTGALFFFQAFEKNRRWSYFAGMLIFSASAMFTRTIGFLLIVSFVVTFLLKHRRAIREILMAKKWLTLILIAILILPFFFLREIGITGYVESHARSFHLLWEEPVRFFTNNFKYHLIDWSALFLN